MSNRTLTINFQALVFLLSYAVGPTYSLNMFSSVLTFIVLGSSNLSDSVPNGSLMTPGLNSVPLINQDPMQIQAALYNYTYTPRFGAHKVHTQVTDWNSARKICMTEGGHLAIINSRAESELIAGLVANSGTHVGSADSDYVHIGFHDLYREGEFVTVSGEPLEIVGFNEWHDGEPNNGGGIEDCGSIHRDGKLNDIWCDKSVGFVCELPQNNPVPNGPLTIPGLNSISLINQDPMQFQAARFNYTYSPGIGAHKVRSTLKTWNAARKACEGDGGHLLIINSEAESRVVVQLLHKHNVLNGWVGIHDHYEKSAFVTIHGESLAKAGFDEWLPGEPNNVGNEEHCAIVTTAGKFSDINCITLSSYICELSGVQYYAMPLPGYVGVSSASDLESPSDV